MKISVLAAGAWGTALACSFAARHQVTLWTRDPIEAFRMQQERQNARYLPDCPLPDNLEISADFDVICRQADWLIIATPMAGLRPTLVRLREAGLVRPLVWVCKGFEAGSGLLGHQIVQQELSAPHLPDYGLLSGPSFADEVARGLPAAVTLAGSRPEFSRLAASELHGKRLRVYANDDLIGVEVGGAVKNVMAIAAGVCDGLALGHNARAALITRGLAEIARFGVALGGKRETLMGLAGMGDLLLTCTGDLSRNRQVGLGLARGKTLDQILNHLGHVAEGVPTAMEVARIAQERGIDMPISQAVASVLRGQLDALTAVETLLARDPRDEHQ